MASESVFDMARGPYLFAHRGAPAQQPENTLESFAQALNVGADVLEIDVHVTLDGHVVVSHDADGQRCAGVAKRIRACSLAEVKAWDLRVGAPVTLPAPVRLPSLAEVLERFPGVPLNVDVKDGCTQMVTSLLACLERHAAAPRVLLTSFSAATLARLRRGGYAGPLGLSRVDAVQALLMPRGMNGVRRLRGQRLQIPLTFAGLRLGLRARIERAHRLGLRVDYWVVNDPAQARALLDLGADGIVTDYPDRIAPVFRDHVRCRAYRERHPSG